VRKDRVFPPVVGIILAVLAMITGTGLLTSCQGGAGQSGIGDGPGMLYFYATW
jgi:hypothetical protein